MGGGHRRVGGGGGGTHAGRNCNPEERKKLTKKTAPGLPVKDLAKLGARLMKQAGGKRQSAAQKMMQEAEEKKKQQQQQEAGEEAVDLEEDEYQRQQEQRSQYAKLQLKARKDQSQFEAAPEMLNAGGKELNPQRELSLRKFFTEFKKVVDVSDVLLEVLDARDPMGCRLKNVEKTVESQWGDRKTVVILLNKVDLVPQEVTDAWMEYFQREQKIVIPFTAASEGTTYGHKRTRSVRRNTCISELYRTLRAIGRGETRDMATGTGARKSLTVGVVGYPNVGKSSIINALRRKTVVGVGNTPGFTTGNTQVDLRKDITILDCPGVVMPGDDDGDVVLRNAVKVDQLSNPMEAVQRLFERCDPNLLSQVYTIKLEHTAGGKPDVDAFVKLVGIRRGRVRQGGVVNELETAKMIIQDWNDGRIGYFTLPPAEDSILTNANVHSANTTENNGQEDRLVLSSFSRTLTADGLPTFHLNPSQSIGGKKRERIQQAPPARRRNDDGTYTSRHGDLEEVEEEEDWSEDEEGEWSDEEEWEDDDEEM